MRFNRPHSRVSLHVNGFTFTPEAPTTRTPSRTTIKLDDLNKKGPEPPPLPLHIQAMTPKPVKIPPNSTLQRVTPRIASHWPSGAPPVLPRLGNVR